MALNRRSFIGLGSLAACGSTLLPPSLLATNPIPAARPLRGGLPLRSGDEQALGFVRRYSSQVRIVGASVLGRIRATGLRGLHVLAEVTDLSSLQAALPTAGVGEVYTEGNLVAFTCGDVDVTVENLVPEVFAARLASLKKAKGVAFAHDGLSYDPETNLLTDPFGGRSGEVRLVNRSFGGVAALAVALRGTYESGQLGLPLGENFGPWRAHILRQIAKSGDASGLTEAFLSSLAALADKIPSPAFQALLHSRLISTALKQSFGIDTSVAIAAFIARRPTAGADVTDGALWLAVLLGAEIASDAGAGLAASWLQNGSRFEVLRSRKALREAGKLVSK